MGRREIQDAVTMATEGVIKIKIYQYLSLVRQPETNPSSRYTVTPHHGPVMTAIPFIRPSHSPGASQLLDHDLCSSQVISPPLHS